MSKSFLPDNYTVPKSDGKFAKIETGDNKFMVCDSVTLGWIYWNIDKKPIRLRENPKTPPADIRADKDGKAERVKHFWAFPVYNMDTKQVQILEITQKSLMGYLQDLAKDKDWGDPVMNYQITIKKSGQNLDTEYQVLPVPFRGEIADIKFAYQESGIDMSKFFDKDGVPEDEQESTDMIADGIIM